RAIRNGTETRYIYDAAGNLLAETDSSNTITRYYIHGAGLLAAVTPTDVVYCYHFDGVGSTVAITDSSQSVVNSYAYTPFGILLNESESFTQPFKYVGGLGVLAEASGFYYMRARYYDPIVGRFISEDPLGFGGGDVNLMVYAGSNPVLLVDPWGLTWQQDVSFIARAVGIVTLEVHIEAFRQVAQVAATSIVLGRISTAAQLTHIQAAALDNSLKAADILNRTGGSDLRDFAQRVDSKIRTAREEVYGNTTSATTTQAGK
ncbi:MAG TPA: hypothetical protein EYP35_00540, partial [Desulfobacterales bacterium]|nr:hypothetical protein [Desulfobacterales bacterium]